MTHSIDLNMIPGGAIGTLHLSQGDVLPSGLTCSLWRDFDAYDLTGCTVKLAGLKPDGNVFRYSAVKISGNTVTFDVTEQMTPLGGMVECEVRVLKGGMDAGTANFFLDIEPSPEYAGPLSDSALSELQLAINASKTAVASASAAKTSENNAAASAKAAATSASAAKSSESKAAASAKAAAASQSAAKSSETAAKASETNAKASETAAKASETNAKSYKDQSAISAASAEDDANLASDYLNSIKALMDDASAVQDFVENYADIIKDIGQQYPVDEYVLDSSGNQILDNFGLPIESRTYESATKHAIRDAESALSLAESVEARVTKLEAWKDSIWLYPHDNALLDSSGSAILDSDGNAIGGQVMLLAI